MDEIEKLQQEIEELKKENAKLKHYGQGHKRQTEKRAADNK